MWERQAMRALGGAIMLWIGCVIATSAQTLSTGQVAGLQVGLDRLGFSPGVIDGRYGSQTRAALNAWQLARAATPTELPSAADLQALVPIDGWSVAYIVTTNDVAALGAAPQDWLERSRVPAMAYQSLRELVAERFHCQEAFLDLLNPAVTNWATLVEGTAILVPQVDPQPLPGAARLVVSLGAKHIRAFAYDGRLIAQFPCSIAARREKRPVGELRVQAIAPDPNYTYDPVNFPELDDVQRGYGKLIIPPGPNNPVGTAWISLNLPGYGIHGTPHPEQIGKTESHGCFRLANWNAERLLGMVEVGIPVEVLDE